MGVTHYGYAFVSGTDHSIHSFSVSNSTYIPEFGSYTYDENDTTYTYYRQGYELGTFSKNDEVEIYLANENDALRSNTPIPGRNFSSFGQRTDKLNHDLQVGQLSLSGTQVNFGIVGVGIDSIIPGDDDGPFGSPLPGKLAIALVSVCFALGFWYIRRKKAFAA